MRKTNWNHTCLLSGLLLLGISAGAQTQNEFSLQQCVDYGLKNSIQVKNALLDVKNQSQVNREVTSAALPQIKASGSFTDYLDVPLTPIPGEFFGQPSGTFKEIAFTTKYTSNGGVTLNQILFDGQVFVGLQARNTSIALAQKSVEVTEDQIKANIYKVYYQLVVGKKQLTSIEANINDISKQLHDAKVMYENGFVEKLDVDKITVQLNNLQTQKQASENQLAAGIAGLKFLINMPQNEALILTDTLSEDELAANMLDESYNYTDRKDMQALQLNTKLNEYNIRRYQLSRIPTLSATANYSKTAFGSSFDFYQGEWFTSSYIGLNLSIPIFDGNQRRAKLQEARYAVEKLRNNVEQLKQSIDNDILQARINMRTALTTISSQRQNVQLAEQVYTTTQKKYQQGLGSNQEMYDAQTQLQIAQNNYYGALYDAIVAKVNYLQASGKL